MDIVNLSLSHVMPWGIQELLLSKTVEMNVTRQQRYNVYQAIKNFFGGEYILTKLPAVICRTVLLSVLEDNLNVEAMNTLASMAFVVSDAILCCMDASGWKDHPLYDEVLSGLVLINQKMLEGRKFFTELRKRIPQQKKKGGARRGRRQRRPKRPKKKIMKITTGQEEFSILVCGDEDSCDACKFLLKKIGDRDKITMDTLTELVNNITDMTLHQSQF